MGRGVERYVCAVCGKSRHYSEGKLILFRQLSSDCPHLAICGSCITKRGEEALDSMQFFMKEGDDDGQNAV